MATTIVYLPTLISNQYNISALECTTAVFAIEDNRRTKAFESHQIGRTNEQVTNGLCTAFKR